MKHVVMEERLRPKLICFDWDGTLINAFDTITNCINESAVSLGYKRVQPKEIEAKIGIPFEQLVTSLYGNVNVSDFEKRYKETYSELSTPKLLPHAFELINQLKHAFLLAIVSNKQQALLEKELKEHKLYHCFDSIWSADRFSAKPSPIMLHNAISAHQVLPKETWMVGDSLPDFYAAQSAHVGKIILLNPTHPPKWGDNLKCIKKLSELYDLLNVTVYD